jgi:uncharacterized protein (TIGR03382 family)
LGHLKSFAIMGCITCLAGSALAATGSISLIDKDGLQFFLNDDITFQTTSSASGACSEARYTQAVAATTLNGGTTTSTLNDMYDGYNSIFVSLTGATGPGETGNPDYVSYANNGPAVSGCPSASNGDREYTFTKQTIGPLQVWRRFFVPQDDSFARWLDLFTNTSGAPVTFTMVTGNNLGSDTNTIITATDSHPTLISPSDNITSVTDTSTKWVATFQNFSGTTSSDVRNGNVLQGTSGAIRLASVHFANGDDNPYWSYAITLQPGQTGIIMNMSVGQTSRAAAAADAQRIVALADPATIDAVTRCLSADELSEVLNFPFGCAGQPDDTPCGADKCANACENGTCVPFTKYCRNFQSSNCTGVCDSTTGNCLAHAAPDGEACNDGDLCTRNDRCTAGVCGGDLLCHACQADADCDDSNVCNGAEKCVSGVCAGGAALSCDDGDACTTDTCSPTTGCAHAALAVCTASATSTSGGSTSGATTTPPPAATTKATVKGGGCSSAGSPSALIAFVALVLLRRRRSARSAL